jgi:hypothetical protein
MEALEFVDEEVLSPEQVDRLATLWEQEFAGQDEVALCPGCNCELFPDELSVGVCASCRAELNSEDNFRLVGDSSEVDGDDFD